MTGISCPSCHKATVEVVNDRGVPIQSRCRSCGWTGPSCFGRKHDEKSQKCVGGADPTYFANRSHVRPPCSAEATCKKEKEKTLMIGRQRVEYPRPAEPARPTAWASPVRPQQTHWRTQPQSQVAPPPPAAQQQQWITPQQASVPAQVPQNYPQPGAQVPAYLTVPEPVEQGLPRMILNAVLRAALKGAFHTAANLMDHVPWGQVPPPGPGGNQGG